MAARIERLFKIIRLLSGAPHRLSAEQIAQAVGVSSRNVMRDLNEIDMLIDIPLVDRSHDGFTMPDLKLIGLITEFDDMQSVSAEKSNQGNPLIKIDREVMTSGMVYQLIRLKEIKAGMSNGSHFKKVFSALIQGLFVKITIKSDDEVEEHLCVPIKVYFDQQLLYISVFDDTFDHLILLEANKICSVRQAEKRLDRKKLAMFREYVNSAWGKMIRHDQMLINQAVFTVDQFIGEYFHRHSLLESQIIQVDSPGRYIVTMDIHQPVEFVRWILRFGDNVTVRGDEDVLREMHGYLAVMMKKYP